MRKDKANATPTPKKISKPWSDFKTSIKMVKSISSTQIQNEFDKTDWTW